MCLYVSPTFLRGVRTGEGSGFPSVLTPLMDLRRRVVNFQLVQLCLVVTMERQLLSSLHASLKLPHYYIKPDSKQSCPLLETVGGGAEHYLCPPGLFTLQMSLKRQSGSKATSACSQEVQKQERPMENHLPKIFPHFHMVLSSGKFFHEYASPSSTPINLTDRGWEEGGNL